MTVLRTFRLDCANNTDNCVALLFSAIHEHRASQVCETPYHCSESELTTGHRRFTSSEQSLQQEWKPSVSHLLSPPPARSQWIPSLADGRRIQDFNPGGPVTDSEVV